MNRAFALNGSVERINNIEDGSSIARQALDLWDESYRTLLAEHPWNFAIKRARLNKHGTPEFGYLHSYKLPTDALRWLPPGLGDCNFFVGEEENGLILTDAGAPLNIRYIANIDDWSLWPPHFAEAMAYKLAMELAESITQIQSNVADAADKFRDVLRTAKRADGLASGNRSRGNVERQSRWMRPDSYRRGWRG